jgi:two-component system response regulator AtoC
MNESEVKIKVFSELQDNSSISSALKQLELKGMSVSISFEENFEIFDNEIIILQIESQDSPYLKKAIVERKDKTNVIPVVMKNGDSLQVTSLLKRGFYDIFIFPYEILKFTTFLAEVISNRSYVTETDRVGSFGITRRGIKSIIGESEKFIKVVELAKKVSEKSGANILLLGETGTGKGLFARAIHDNGTTGQFPFIDIVCTAIPETLLESELFGYEAGAFTNARNRKIGLFELADRGTLFLDEIGDLSPNIQTKLLRAIEKKVIKRLGGVVDIPVNARIISATNKDIEIMVEENLFRRDLYHRLNVVTIDIPPLREREDDVIILANHFISEFNKQFTKSVKRVDKNIQHFLKGYQWPGNVRELKNSIERAVLLSDNGKLTLEDFSNIIKSVQIKPTNGESDVDLSEHLVKFEVAYGTTDLKKLEKFYAREILKKLKGNKTQTAKLLGISRPKLDILVK